MIMEKTKYSELIASIQKKRRWVIIWSFIATAAIFLATEPLEIQVMGEMIVDWQGLSPILGVILILISCIVEVFAYAAVSMPLTASLDMECDPEKQLILNMHFDKGRKLYHIYATDYMYLGRYEEAIPYANEMIKSKKDQMVLAGLYTRARCEFFLGQYENFRYTAACYEDKLASCQNMKPQAKLMYQKISRAMFLMFMISQNDYQKINELRFGVEPWNNSKATEGFVQYIKGVAAFQVGDREEAVYRLRYVKDNCSKTVLAPLADGYLEQLK